MLNAKQAADGIRNVAVKFRGFLEAAEYLEKIGDLEQAEKEAIKRKELAENAACVAENNLNSAEEALSKAEIKIKNSVAYSKQIEDESQERAEKIIASAQEESDKRLASADAKAQDRKNEIEKLNEYSKGIQAQIDERQAELDKINKQIEEAKAHLRKFIGA